MSNMRNLRRSIERGVRGVLGHPKSNARPYWPMGNQPVGAKACRAYMHQCRVEATDDRIERRRVTGVWHEWCRELEGIARCSLSPTGRAHFRTYFAAGMTAREAHIKDLSHAQ